MDIFIQLSLILLVVLGVSFIMRLLKQPLIIGYIISGILIGPFFMDFIPEKQITLAFSQFGVAFLLFIVGIHLSPKVIKEVGRISLITGIGQVVFTSVIGYFIGLLLGFSRLTSIYVAFALTFSSTIIIMKLLSDKDSLDKLYGKISIGFLLVQDVIAIVALIIISSFSAGLNAGEMMLSVITKGGLIFLLLFPISYYILPKLSTFFAKSQELLFVFSISWGLGLAALFYFAGFSIEVGALIAGVLLSMSPYSYEVSSKMKPLRDFFIISFFIILGSQLVFSDARSFLIPIIVFSLFILLGNPLIVMILMGLFGYSKNTGFMAGLTVAQISEFSLILIALGVNVGHLDSNILSFVTVIGLITIAGSTYMITYSEKIYPFLSKYLSIFEKKNVREKNESYQNYDCLLFGENRAGFSIMNEFIRMKKKYTVVDFDPERVRRLCSKGISCIYGDVSDTEFLESIRVDRAKMIVSTIPDIETNILILDFLKQRNNKAVLIATASQASDALELYRRGADYVILPHFLGGKCAAELIENAKMDREKYKAKRVKDIAELKKRTALFSNES